jgi:parallel beta-helix repeat protein
MKSKLVGFLVVTLLITTAISLVEANDSDFDRQSENEIIVPDDYSTIQAAIDNSDDGDTIFVRAGTYYENVIVDKSISLIGENRETTIIDANNEGTVVSVSKDNVKITGFNITNSGDFELGVTPPSGIMIRDSSHSNISGNIISNNLNGLMIGLSECIIIHENLFINDGILFVQDFKPYYNHDIQNNIVNGKPLYYFKNKDDFAVPSNAGQIILYDCDNVLISEMDIENTDWAVQLFYCHDCIVQNSKISNNEWIGIHLRFSDEITIQNNTLSSNRAYGTDFEYSACNNIINNLIDGDTWIGISLYECCEKNRISGNTIETHSIHTIFDHPSTGIWLRDYCSQNEILDNEISNCQIGLWMGCSHSNIINNNHIHNCHIASSQNSKNINSKSIKASVLTRGAGLYLVETGKNDIQFNTFENNDIGAIMFRSWMDTLQFNNIMDSSTGIDFLSFLSLGYYPMNYWGSSLTGTIFKSNKLFCLLPWSPARISEAP